MTDDSTPTEDRLPRRVLDLEALKALAHPLRVQLIDALSTYGPATASGLADRLSESSGATSYHLRQLAKHGFVREVEGWGNARERWWERTPQSMEFSSPEIRATEAGRSANRLVSREMITNRERHLRDYIDRADAVLTGKWLKSGGLSVINLRLTEDQFEEASLQLEALTDEFVEKWRGREAPGARPVQFQINAIPILDAFETPEDQTPEEES